MLLDGFAVIAVGFDNVLHTKSIKDWPEIGEPVVCTIRQLKVARAGKSKIILDTWHEGADLEKVLDWCERQGLHFDAVNSNLPEVEERYSVKSHKILADSYWEHKIRWVPNRSEDTGSAPLVNSGVALTVAVQSLDPNPVTEFVAGLLDTGSAYTSISNRLNEKLKLPTIRVDTLEGANGSFESPVHRATVIFDESMRGPAVNVEVHEFHTSDKFQCDVIIGRDLMSILQIVWDGPTSSIRILADDMV